MYLPLMYISNFLMSICSFILIVSYRQTLSRIFSYIKKTLYDDNILILDVWGLLSQFIEFFLIFMVEYIEIFLVFIFDF